MSGLAQMKHSNPNIERMHVEVKDTLPDVMPALEGIRFSEISSLDRTTTETLNLGSALD